MLKTRGIWATNHITDSFISYIQRNITYQCISSIYNVPHLWWYCSFLLLKLLQWPLSYVAREFRMRAWWLEWTTGFSSNCEQDFAKVGASFKDFMGLGCICQGQYIVDDDLHFACLNLWPNILQHLLDDLPFLVCLSRSQSRPCRCMPHKKVITI